MFCKAVSDGCICQTIEYCHDTLVVQDFFELRQYVCVQQKSRNARAAANKS